MTLFLRPTSKQTSWRLACALATTPRSPDHEKDLREAEEELAARGKTIEEIDDMVDLASWANEILNPVAGGTAESNGQVHQIVSDSDDLELAVEVAQPRNLPTREELVRVRSLIERHRD